MMKATDIRTADGFLITDYALARIHYQIRRWSGQLQKADLDDMQQEIFLSLLVDDSRYNGSHASRKTFESAQIRRAVQRFTAVVLRSQKRGMTSLEFLNENELPSFNHSRQGEIGILDRIYWKIDPLPQYRIKRFLSHSCSDSDGADSVASDIIYETWQNAFDERIKFRWKNTFALPRPENRSIAGRRLYRNDHWQHAAFLRGVHYAMEHVIFLWNKSVRHSQTEEVPIYDFFIKVTLPCTLKNVESYPEESISLPMFEELRMKDGQYECMIPIK